MNELTFEQLPQAVTALTDEIREIKRLLLEKSNEAHPQLDKWFDIAELCAYLPDKPARATVYGMVHFGKIPHHKGQKKLRFLKSEVDAWLMQGKRKTFAETNAEAGQYLNKKGLKNG